MKKSLYIYLCSLMGSLLFLILHRIVVFFSLLFISYRSGGFSSDLAYLQFLAFDYFTLILALLAGLWYGIWVGSFWYEAIYEKGEHGGLVHHMVRHYWPSRGSRYDLKGKIEQAAKKMESELWQIEDLAGEISDRQALTVKRRAARKLPPKK